jgi:hypothetical protein
MHTIRSFTSMDVRTVTIAISIVEALVGSPLFSHLVLSTRLLQRAQPRSEFYPFPKIRSQG